jgi:alkylated DNA repair dioxygenase AlkB
MSTEYPPAPVLYVPDFYPNAEQAFETLYHELPWVSVTPARREWYTNKVPVPYTYGTGERARTYEQQDPHPLVTLIGDMLSGVRGEEYEVCFANLYENERNALGWHADDSPEMDPERSVVTVSFGAERDILVSSIEANRDGMLRIGSPLIESFRLGSGSAMFMLPGMQQTHYHRIPKASFKCGPRISLTYRGYRAV